MKHYPQKSSRKPIPVSYRIVVSALLIVVTAFTIFPHASVTALLSSVKPFAFFSRALRDTWEITGTALSNRFKLANELQSARTALDSANERLMQYQATLDELRLFSGLSVQKKTTAAVLSYPPSTPYDTFVILAGTKNGVSVGDVVTTLAGTPLGTIESVLKQYARVRLYSSPGREILVHIGTAEVSVIAHGIGGGAFEALLPRESAVAIGDKVTVPGMAPPLIAVVNSVDTPATDYLALVRFNAPVNIFSVRYVQVLPVDSERATLSP